MRLHAHLGRLAQLLGGIPVLECLPGGPAAEAGVRYGDVLVSVNGAPTPTLEDYLRALEASDGTPLLRLFRDGTYYEIRLRLSRSSFAPSGPSGARALRTSGRVGHA
jgi:S1-C subfamily serine protease